MQEINTATSLWTRFITFASITTLLPNSPPMDPLAHPQRTTSLLSKTVSIVSSPEPIDPITIPKRASSLENTLHPGKPIVIPRRRSSLVNRLSSVTLDDGNGLLNDLKTDDMSLYVLGGEVDAVTIFDGNKLAVKNEIHNVVNQPDITEKEANIATLQEESINERDRELDPMATLKIDSLLDVEIQTNILYNEKSPASALDNALLTSISDAKAIEIAKGLGSPSLSSANSSLSTTLHSQNAFVFGPDGRLCRDTKHPIHVVTFTPSSTSCQIMDTPIHDANSTASQLQTPPSNTEPSITSLNPVTSFSSPIKLSTPASTTLNQQINDPDSIISIPSLENPLATFTISDATIHPKNSSPRTKFGKILKKCGLSIKSWMVEKKQRMLCKMNSR